MSCWDDLLSLNRPTTHSQADNTDKMVIWPSSLQSSPYNEQNCRSEDKTEIGSEVQNDKTSLIASFQPFHLLIKILQVKLFIFWGL